MEAQDLPQKPLELFRTWYSDYLKTKPKESTSVTLSTAGENGFPSARVVLMKDYDESGFVFYTNYLSCKSGDLEKNPKAELLFFWEPLMRQIRVTGWASKTTDQESDEYFATRPYLSQIGAWASHQSRKIESRKWLEEQVEGFRRKYPEGRPVPRPPNWGGWRIRPAKIEFWQGRENRLHDRFLYEADGSGWKISRLSP